MAMPTYSADHLAASRSVGADVEEIVEEQQGHDQRDRQLPDQRPVDHVVLVPWFVLVRCSLSAHARAVGRSETVELAFG
jgi:hypothetical protein